MIQYLLQYALGSTYSQSSFLHRKTSCPSEVPMKFLQLVNPAIELTVVWTIR